MALSIRRFQLSIWSLLLILGPAIAVVALMRSVVALSVSAHTKDEDYLNLTTDVVASSLEKYLAREVATAAAVGQLQWLINEVDRLGSPAFRLDDVMRKDARWRAGSTADTEPVLKNELSQFLKAFIDSPYKELLIADARGRLVAASNLTEDYYQADEPQWWPVKQDTTQEGFDEKCGSSPANCRSIVDVAFDPSAKATAFAIVVPIVDQNHRVRGVMKAVVDTTALQKLIELAYRATPLEGHLLTVDGHDVLDPSFDPPMTLKEELQRLQKGEVWSSGDQHLRRTESSFQKHPWIIYSREHADGFAPSARRTLLLEAFAALMVIISGMGAAIAFTDNRERASSKS